MCNISQTGHLYLNRALFPRAFYAVSYMRGTDWTMNGNRLINEPSTGEDFVDLS